MPADAEHEPEVRGRRVVVGVDGSVPSMDALRMGALQARNLGLPLEVVHARVIDQAVSQLIPGAETQEEAVLEQAVDEARAVKPGLEVVGRLVDPPPAARLVESSRGAALLVVGSRGLGGFKQLMLGSVSQECVHHAHCPVLVVRASEEGGES